MYNSFLKVILLCILLNACNDPQPSAINYADQLPPGDTAKLFAPGIISTNNYEHSAPAFSPDGKVVLWTVVDKSYRGSMYEMTFENGKWSPPHRPAFADSTADDYYPGFSADGKKLYFSSRRKMPAGYPATKDMRIWEVERTADGWSVPHPIDTTVSTGVEYAHSASQRGNIFYSIPMSGGNNMNIFTSTFVSGKYSPAIQLPYNLNSIGYEDGPYIAPDESFLIFESNRPEGIDGSIDLYISFKNDNGSWSLPVNMGPEINSTAAERFAKLSPDGKYLFFGTNRNMSDSNWGFDIYWIDAKVIDDIKARMTREEISAPLGERVLVSMNNQDTDSLDAALKEWLLRHPNTLDAIVMYSAALRKQKSFTEAERLLGNINPELKNAPAVILESALIAIGMNRKSEADSLLRNILQPGQRQAERMDYLSGELLNMGMFDESEKYFDQSMQLQPNPYQYLRRARKYAIMGRNEKALMYATKAAESGINSRADYENDPELQTLKKDPGWNELMKKLK